MAGAGYKTFADGNVLTAADVNTYLMEQSVMVFADASARTSGIASPSEGMVTYLTGSDVLEYYDGSAWQAVSAGGGGKVLQVVQSVYSTDTTITSTSYTDTGLSATITPSAATSKVLAIVSLSHTTDEVGSLVYALAQSNLVRTSTQIYEATTILNYIPGSNGVGLGTNSSYSYLDSPSTTSATTYKVQSKCVTGTQSIISDGNTDSSLILMEIGA